MLHIFLRALENFCIHQIRESYRVDDDVTKMRTVIASIDVELLHGGRQRVYLGATHAFAQRVAALLLEEESSDEETLADMMLETANLVVGSAKILTQEDAASAFSISLPKLEKIALFDISYDAAKTLYIQKDAIILAIKEL